MTCYIGAPDTHGGVGELTFLASVPKNAPLSDHYLCAANNLSKIERMAEEKGVSSRELLDENCWDVVNSVVGSSTFTNYLPGDDNEDRDPSEMENSTAVRIRCQAEAWGDRRIMECCLEAVSPKTGEMRMLRFNNFNPSGITLSEHLIVAAEKLKRLEALVLMIGMESWELVDEEHEVLLSNILSRMLSNELNEVKDQRKSEGR